jgi:hypothetical protein
LEVLQAIPEFRSVRWIVDVDPNWGEIFRRTVAFFEWFPFSPKEWTTKTEYLSPIPNQKSWIWPTKS